MRRTFVLFAFLSFGLVLQAQDFRPGFILSLDNDSIFGYVAFREGLQRFDVCDYRQNTGEAGQQYKPHQIKGYGFFGDRFYQSIRLQPENQDTLEVFAEVLLAGELTLLRYQHLFFAYRARDEMPLQVSFGREEVFIDGHVYVRDSKKHIGILNYLMSDCPELHPGMQKLGANEKQLTQLFEKYHQCRELPFLIPKEGKPWLSFDIGAALVMAPTWFRYGEYAEQDRHNFSNALFKSNFTPSFSPGIGLLMDIGFPRLQEKTTLNTGLIYHYKNFYSFTEANSLSSTRIERRTYNFNLHELKVPFGIKYTLAEREFTYYIMLGGSFTQNLKCDHYYLREVEYEGEVVFDLFPALLYKNNQFGLWAGVGVYRQFFQKHLLFLEFRTEYTNGLTDLIDYEIFHSSLIGLQFFGGIKF